DPGRDQLVVVVIASSLVPVRGCLGWPGVYAAATVAEAEGRLGDRLLRDRGSGQLGGNPAACYDQHPVGKSDDLFDLGGDHQDRHALRGAGGDQVVDCPLGADVDTACRFVGDQ